MITKPAVAALMGKAEKALKSSLDLLPSDPDGACNRAYYAMFDSARAALSAAGFGTGGEVKTHSGLMTIFARDLVKPGRIDAAYSRAFSQVQFLRQLADYAQEPVETAKASYAVSEATAFVTAMRTFIASLQAVQKSAEL